MKQPVVVTYSSSDLDHEIANASAVEIADALSKRVIDEIVVRALSDLSEELLSRAKLVYTCDSFPLPVWLRELDQFGNSGLKTYLETNRIPYIGSSPSSVSVSKDKIASKARLIAASVRTPRLFGIVGTVSLRDIIFPAVYKPRIGSGSSGITYLDNADAFEAFVASGKSDADGFIEEYIAGSEVTIAVVQTDRKLVAHAPFEIVISDKILTVALKNTKPYPRFRVVENQEQIRRAAISAFEALGCQHYGRVDLRVDAFGNPFVLEVNTAPRLSKSSFFATSAKLDGVAYDSLVFDLYQAGLRRFVT